MWRGGIGYAISLIGLQLNLKSGICEDICEQRRMAFRVFFVKGFLDRLFWTCLAYSSIGTQVLIRPATMGSAPMITIVSEDLTYVNDINYPRPENDWVPCPIWGTAGQLSNGYRKSLRQDFPHSARCASRHKPTHPLGLRKENPEESDTAVLHAKCIEARFIWCANQFFMIVRK